jgi:hypothetical protein
VHEKVYLGMVATWNIDWTATALELDLICPLPSRWVRDESVIGGKARLVRFHLPPSFTTAPMIGS